MTIRRYGRFWAVYDSDGALVCVTVYRKGAVEVVRRLTAPSLSVAPAATFPPFAWGRHPAAVLS